MAEFFMPLRSVFEYVSNVESSIALRESQYVWSLFEVAHVVTMCLFAGLIVMMDLRLLGVGNMQSPFSQVQKRLFPWQMVGMTLSAITGLVLVYGDPMRFYANIFFWMKMLIMVIAATFHHAQLGLQVVIEDYVHNEGVKIAAIIAVKLLAALMALIGTVAVLKLAVAG